MNRKRLLALVFVSGAIVGAAFGSSASSSPRNRHVVETGSNPIPVGTSMEIAYPTGQTVTGMNGAHPQPEYRTVKLRVVRVNTDGPSTLGSPFRIRIGDTTYYAVEEGN